MKLQVLDNLQYMQSHKRKKIGPVLSIRTDSLKGLELSWNLSDIQFPAVQYYHIFLFLTDDLEAARTFYWNYWHHLKPGQIFGIFSFNKQYFQAKTKISWEQKSGQNNYPHNVKNSHLIANLDQLLFDQIAEIVQKRRGLIVLNIFSYNEKSMSRQKFIKVKMTLQTYINKARVNCRSKDRMLYNLISNNLSPSQYNNNNGFNLISFQTVNAHYTCMEMLKYVRTIILKTLSITLSTEQKLNILSCNHREWLVSDGLEMTKWYFSIPKINFSEHIMFYQTKNQPLNTFQIQICLNFIFLDDSQMRDKKRITVNPINNRNFLQTIDDTADLSKFGMCELLKGIFVNTNLIKQEKLAKKCCQKQRAQDDLVIVNILNYESIKLSELGNKMKELEESSRHIFFHFLDSQ